MYFSIFLPFRNSLASVAELLMECQTQPKPTDSGIEITYSCVLVFNFQTLFSSNLLDLKAIETIEFNGRPFYLRCARFIVTQQPFLLVNIYFFKYLKDNFRHV